MDETKDIKYPMYLKYDSRFFCVLGEITADTQPFKNGKGYVYNDYVWIFSNEPPKSSKYPYFWYEHGKLLFGKMRDSIKEEFHVSKLMDLSPTETVGKISENETLYDEQALFDMNAATTIYVPTIREEDDYLKQIIKRVIIEKRVNTNRLKSKMAKSYSFSNLKTGLEGTTKMSVSNFIIWCDLLGISFNIVAYDNGVDRQNPLKSAVYYNSREDSYTMINNLEVKNF